MRKRCFTATRILLISLVPLRLSGLCAISSVVPVQFCSGPGSTTHSFSNHFSSSIARKYNNKKVDKLCNLLAS